MAKPNQKQLVKLQALLKEGIQSHQQGDLSAAASAYKSVLKKLPNQYDAAQNLAMILMQQNQVKEAYGFARTAVKAQPKSFQARYVLACVFEGLDDLEQAVNQHLKCLKLKPDCVESLNNLGLIYGRQLKYEQAIECFKKVLTIQANSAYALANYGNALKDFGENEKAIEAIQKAISAAPELLAAQSNLLLTMNYISDITPDELSTAHQKWSEDCQRFLHNKPSLPPLVNSDIKQRHEKNGKLRVGFVSADFHRHSVPFFLLPLLKKLKTDYSATLATYAYANNTRFDTVSEQIQRNVDTWQGIQHLDDVSLSQLIRRDEIDILIDLSGHTANNRLVMFAMKPAPIQVTWLGYPNTTGLPNMDYRLVDKITDLPGNKSQAFASEKLLYLPDSFLCYEGDNSLSFPDTHAKPTGGITFGSFNNSVKISPENIELWASLLNKVKHSSLLLKSKPLANQAVCERILDSFKRHGIDASRLKLVSQVDSFEAHMRLYEEVDIALDTFPYNGTTTTCEALWMGTPVICMQGRQHAGRVSASLINHSGLDIPIATSPDEYVANAVKLATRIETEGWNRAEQREILEASTLCDANAFTEGFVQTLTKVWQQRLSSDIQ